MTVPTGFSRASWARLRKAFPGVMTFDMGDGVSLVALFVGGSSPIYPAKTGRPLPSMLYLYFSAEGRPLGTYDWDLRDKDSGDEISRGVIHVQP